MIASSALPGVLAGLGTITVDGSFSRAVKLEYLQGPPPGAPAGSPPQPLWAGGAAANGARYTPVDGQASLYLATNGATALAEVDAVLFDRAAGLVAGAAHDPLVVVAAEARLPCVLDLCDSYVQAALGTSHAELTQPWLRAQARHRAGIGPLPPTQALGRAAFAAGSILALRYPSRKHPGQKNLVVFTERLATLNGSITVVDARGILRHSLP